MDVSLDADVSSEPSISPLESEPGEEEAPVHPTPTRMGGAAKKGGVRGGGDGAGECVSTVMSHVPGGGGKGEHLRDWGQASWHQGKVLC